jgi:hypothetical protein
MFEVELIEALNCNGFANIKTATLEYVYANTLQDGQYAAGARRNADILAKYLDKYGKLTMSEIRGI